MSSPQKAKSSLITDASISPKLWILQLSHDDGRDLAPVVGLFPVRRPAVAEKKRFVLPSTETMALDDVESAAGKAPLDIARKVEPRARTGVSARKEAAVLFILPQKLRLELGPDLVGGLIDARPNGGADAAPRGPDPFHRRYRCINHAAKRTTPARMDGGNDLGLRIREQHRRAVGGQRADDKAGRPRHQRVRFREGAARQRLVRDNSDRTVHLVKRHHLP